MVPRHNMLYNKMRLGINGVDANPTIGEAMKQVLLFTFPMGDFYYRENVKKVKIRTDRYRRAYERMFPDERMIYKIRARPGHSSFRCSPCHLYLVIRIG